MDTMYLIYSYCHQHKTLSLVVCQLPLGVGINMEVQVHSLTLPTIVKPKVLRSLTGGFSYDHHICLTQIVNHDSLNSYTNLTSVPFGVCPHYSKYESADISSVLISACCTYRTMVSISAYNTRFLMFISQGSSAAPKHILQFTD